MAKSSMDSSSRNDSSSYSRRTFRKVALRTRSSLMRIILMQSHTSFTVGLIFNVAIMLAGTTLQIVSSAMRSTWNSA
jgi:hypothetical protein